MARLRKKKKKEKYVRICPKCKLPDVRMDKSTLQQLGALPVMYICNKCGYSGYAFPEVKISELDDFEKEIDKESLRTTKKAKSELIDTSYGKFGVRFVWKYESIFSLLIGIILLFVGFKYGVVFCIVGIIFILLGIVMFYITYFKKKKLKE